MAILAGDHAKVFVDGYELTADSNTVTVNDSVMTYEVTAFSDQVHKFIRGSRIVTVDHAGYMEAAAARSHPVLKDVSVSGVVSTVLGQNTAPVVGSPMYSLLTQQSKYSTLPRTGSHIPFMARFANRGDLGGWGSALAVAEAVTNTQSGVAVDGGAQTENGGAAFLHVLQAAASDTYVITIEGSITSDFASPITLGVFTLDASALGSERIPIPDTIQRYTRCRAVRTGSADNIVRLSVNLVRF